MFKQLLFVAIVIFCVNQPVFSQGDYIYSKEGKRILNRRNLVLNCLKSMNTDRSNKSAVSICECQVNIIDRHFTYRQFNNATTKGVIDLSTLINSDPGLKKRIEECYQASNQTVWLSAQGFREEMIKTCQENILSESKRKVDSNKVAGFCQCQVDLIKANKFTDEEMKTLNDPNSVLYYQVMYNCGDPFAIDDFETEWGKSSFNDINGPEQDTIKMLPLNGMHYVKIKIGTIVYFWLFDTGASDMLVTKEVEKKLLKEHVMNPENYLGIGYYEMANGEMDTCRKYKVDGLQIGQYSINNIVIAVSDKAKKVIAGKMLLNKFTNWMIDNSENTLIVNK